jgi:hypothetical protein
MIESDREKLQRDSFVGFLGVGELRNYSLSQVPDEPGVYVFLRESDQEVKFLDRSIGGHFKKKDPTVSLDDLEKAWVHATTIYIGKAGKAGGSATLRSRLKQYLSFGKGAATAHWGGRYIWQLADAEEFIVCWRTADVHQARTIERMQQTDFGVTALA